MNKLIIYLDQNFISDIAKLSVDSKKNKVNPKLENLFSLIKEGVDEEKFVVPDSWIHQIETSAIQDKKINDLVHSRLKNIGQVSLNPTWEIINSQFIDSLLNFLNIKLNRESEWWRIAFKENPNKRMANFDFSVKIPNIDWNALFPDTTSNLQGIRNSGVKFQDQHKKEIKVTRKVYKNKLKTDYKYSLSHYKISECDAEKFIDSDEFIKIPNIDIFSKLWSKDLSNTNRQGKESDYNDVEMLSSYFPYVDIMATDNYWKTQIKGLNLNQIYNCHTFSMKEAELDEFIGLIGKESKNRISANQSIFSVLCILPKDKNFYPVDFLKKINMARGKFQNTGKYWDKEIYVDVFLECKKDNVKFPSPELIKKYGPRAFNHDQRSEFLIFGNNFKKIYNPKNKSVDKLVLKIPAHSRGPATAIITDKTKFDVGLREHDSDVFCDIEEAINKKFEYTLKYKIKIIY